MTRERETLLRVFDHFRQIDLNLHIKTAAILTMIAENEGISQVELKQRLQVQVSTISRMVSELVNHKLVERREGEHRSFNALYLTPKGRLFFNTLQEIFVSAREKDREEGKMVQ